jgi:L-threonylcarbamoyladenylate synthase
MGTRRRRVSVIYFISKLVKWDDLRMAIILDCTKDSLKVAAKALKEGHLVAFPTETVYGLGADATNENAVSRIYVAKARPTDHPLIVHISSINHLGNWAIDIPDYAIKLARKFWPGPLTLILKRSDLAKDFITAGQENVGVRVPENQAAQNLLKEFEALGGLGVVAPSANRFGAVSPTNSSHVTEELGETLRVSDLILDGGPSSIGIESTIVSCLDSQPVILRPGAITTQMVERATGLHAIEPNLKYNIKAAGLLASHYSPKAKVILDQIPNPGDGFLAMSNIPTPEGSIRLASPENLEQYASELYSALRSGDDKNLAKIYVVLPIGTGLGEAIRDRLLKSAY